MVHDCVCGRAVASISRLSPSRIYYCTTFNKAIVLCVCVCVCVCMCVCACACVCMCACACVHVFVCMHVIQCSTIQFHVRELHTAFNRLCNSTTDPIPNPEEWESIQLTHIGSINTRTTVMQTFVIPSSSVPQTAREALVYAYIVAGNTDNRSTHVKIFTEKSHSRRFEKYLSLQTWPQNAHTMTVDNMWFPLTTNRRIYVAVTAALGEGTWGNIYITGYC